LNVCQYNYQTTRCNVPEDSHLQITGVFKSHNKDDFLRAGEKHR
jgi:hypothetical protein